jgi:hypothetical protein
MPPRTRRPTYDPYAEHRCKCRHIVYADDQPGGKCRFCGCTDHQAPASRPAPVVDEEAEAARALDATEAAGHGDHAGFTRDSRDPAGQVTCSCGVVVGIPERGAA